MRDAAMDVEGARHLFMQHVDSSDLDMLVRAINFLPNFLIYTLRKFRELKTVRLSH